MHERHLRVPGPDHLDAQNPDLGLESGQELQEVKLVVIDEVESLTDDAVDGFLRGLEQIITSIILNE